MVNTGIGELPPGAELSDSDDYDQVDVNDPHRALNIDLDMPLREDERLPVLEHRVVENNLVQENVESKGKKKEKVIFCFSFFFLVYFKNYSCGLEQLHSFVQFHLLGT